MNDELLSGLFCRLYNIFEDSEKRHVEGISGRAPMSTFVGGSISGNGGNSCEEFRLEAVAVGTVHIIYIFPPCWFRSDTGRFCNWFEPLCIPSHLMV